MSLDLLGPGWSALGVLDRVAAADPPYHALIDAGALVTGLLVAEAAQTNEAVRCWAA